MDDIAGYALRRPLGGGSVGVVWSARHLASGRAVVVKRVPGSMVENAELFRRDLALARGLDHPHVARLLEVRQAEREWLLISEHLPAGTLTELLQRRGPLRLGELVTLLAPLAQALGAAHRAGLIHAHLGTNDVMFTADGRPVLTDLGLRLISGRDHHPATDLTDLAALATTAGAGPEVLDLLRASAETAAERLLALTPPEPIILAFGNGPHLDASPVLPRPTPAWWNRRSAVARHPPRPHRRLLLAIALAAAIVVPVGVVLTGQFETPSAAPTPAHSRPPPPATTPQPSAHSRPSPTATTRQPSVAPRRAPAAWHATLRALDVRRSAAFATVDARKLDTVYLPGSRPWQSDRTMLASYRARGLRVLGLAVRIERVAVARASPDQVVLTVVDRLVRATAVDAAGRRTALPPSPAVTRLITLTGPQPHWRISRVTAA